MHAIRDGMAYRPARARALSLCRTAIASRSDEKGQNESVFWVSFALALALFLPRWLRLRGWLASRQQFGMQNNNVVM